MLIETGYDRRRAVEYALRWALSRNPEYYNFDNIGGDCTNFVSQCLYAGCRVMNYSGDDGWYYIDLDTGLACVDRGGIPEQISAD